MKYGINLSINVSKVDKARLFQGQKGAYLDLTLFFDPETQDQFGQNGTITQSISKEERAQKVKMPIIGNAKIFWTDGQESSGGHQQPAAGFQHGMRSQNANPPWEDDAPF